MLPAEISTAHTENSMFTAVAYIKLGGFDHGVTFGPEFTTAAQVWEWLHDSFEEPCNRPPYDYIQVESAAVY